MTKLDEYVIDEQAENVESTVATKEERPTSWARVFEVDVPLIYLEDGLDFDGVPKLLPRKWFLYKYYKEANNAGYGFNQYALARALKSERGPTTGGASGEKWTTFSRQYKAIGSMILCRMIGCGGMPNYTKSNIYGPGKLYPQTTGLVKIAVAGKHSWGPFSKKGNNRAGAAFATAKDINFDDPDDRFLLDVAWKIITGPYFIGEEIYGAISFVHPKNRWNQLGIYRKTDVKSVRRAHRELNKESPYGNKQPPGSMGKFKACWTGPLDDPSGGMQATEIVCYTKLPFKSMPKLRTLPKNVPWTEKDLPRIPDPPGFENARKKNLLRTDYQIATKKKPSLAEFVKEEHSIRPLSELYTPKDSKNNFIPAQKSFFVMDGHLVNALRKVSNIDLAMTTSFVELFYYDREDQKNTIPINAHLIDNPDYTPGGLEENMGRPDAGLIGVDIATQDEYNSQVYSRITLRFKVYNPDVFNPGGIMSPFLYTGQPFGIKYGTKYSGPNDNEMVKRILNWSETKLANPTHYDINIDDKGVYDFTVHATGGAEHAMNKMSIGSFMFKDTDETQDDFTRAYKTLKLIKSAITEIGKKRDHQKATNTLTKQQAKELKKQIKLGEKTQKKQTNQMRAAFGNMIAERFKNLEARSVTNPNYEPKKKGKQKRKNWISIGNVIHEFCEDDLAEALMLYTASESPQPALVWGKFNKNCGDYANKVMHEFLIPLDDFKSKIQSQSDVLTQTGIRLDWFLTTLTSYFHNDPTLYKLNKKKGTYENFQPCNFISFVQHDIDLNGKEYVQYIIADRNRGIDFAQEVTQIFMPNEENVELMAGEKEADPVEPLSRGQRKLALNEKNCAYIQLMEAHAFVRNVNMHAEVDPHIIPISIEKTMGYKSVVADIERENVPTDKYDPATTLDRLRLPLAGTIEVIAFPFWKPLRCIYMFFNTEDWDRFYTIKNVTLSYTVGLPIASLDLMYCN